MLWSHIVNTLKCSTSPEHWPSSRRFVWEQSPQPSLLGNKNPHYPLTNIFFCIWVCSKWGGPPMKKHCSPCRHWSASVLVWGTVTSKAKTSPPFLTHIHMEQLLQNQQQHPKCGKELHQDVQDYLCSWMILSHNDRRQNSRKQASRFFRFSSYHWEILPTSYWFLC